MKKIVVAVLILIAVLAASVCGFGFSFRGVPKISVPEIKNDIEKPASADIGNTPAVDLGNGVKAHGALKLLGTQLVDKNNSPVVLKGMSSHGLVWFPDFAKKYSIEKTKEFGANVFRVAMYTEEYGGYTTGANEKANSKKILYETVESALSLDMYVIIDWHILNDNNPQKHKAEAAEFFNEVSLKYADNPGVIYEICNEPHGVSWKNDIKPYAEDIIKVIRKNSPNAVIIVGTNTWSQDVDEASGDKLGFSNIMYAFHFYAGTHELDNFKPKIEKALSDGAAVFVSEWGTSDASGNNGNYLDKAQKWLDYLDSKGISRVNWALCNKDESSAAIVPSANAASWGQNDLSVSGKFVMESFK